MNENYIKNLSQNQNILMILNRIFTIKELSLKIIFIKSQLEKKDIHNYYNEIYNKIASAIMNDVCLCILYTIRE